MKESEEVLEGGLVHGWKGVWLRALNSSNHRIDTMYFPHHPYKNSYFLKRLLIFHTHRVH